MGERLKLGVAVTSFIEICVRVNELKLMRRKAVEANTLERENVWSLYCPKRLEIQTKNARSTRLNFRK